MPLRMQVVAMTAECDEIDRFILATIFHPHHMMKLEREDIAARWVRALVPSFAKNLVANQRRDLMAFGNHFPCRLTFELICERCTNIASQVEQLVRE